MKHTIELKHVGPAQHVRRLLEELIDRLEERLVHLPKDAVFLHVVFEENGTHKLYRTSLSCHVPGRSVAAREENRSAGTAIREAFEELERQLEKYRTTHNRVAARGRRARLLRMASQEAQEV